MTWEEVKREEEKKSYYQELMKFIDNEYNSFDIYPPKENIFKALELTPLDKVLVVLIGQDPYATPGYAMGLSFSVNDGVTIPKSLKNIYKELNNELGLSVPTTGNLTPLAKRGVLLLNLILTVRKNEPLSHKNKGWESFTIRLIQELNKQERKMVFILLGNEAQRVVKYLDNPLHKILMTSHPSPLGAYHGFFGSNIFLKANEYLNLPKDFWRITNEDKN